MTNILLVFFLAIVLFSLEIILPGGILGVFGGIMLLFGVYLTYDLYGPLLAVVVFAGSLVFAAAFFVLQYKILPKLPFGKNIFLNSRIEGASNINNPGDEILGKEGVVATRMTPGGAILIDGKRHDAISQTGMLETGTAVTVVGRDAFRLVVRKKDD
ncbi:MAG: hypothetical protein JJT96_13470 [Opitutales bacterium]|nr:hypothetical protein [Opitutales bacterium]